MHISKQERARPEIVHASNDQNPQTDSYETTENNHYNKHTGSKRDLSDSESENTEAGKRPRMTLRDVSGQCANGSERAVASEDGVWDGSTHTNTHIHTNLHVQTKGNNWNGSVSGRRSPSVTVVKGALCHACG